MGTETQMPEHREATNPPLKIDFFYGLVTLGSATLWSVLTGWMLYFYQAPEGKGLLLVPPALYSIALLLARVVNAVSAPPIGYWSDRTRTPRGRRLPFMFYSGLPLLALFVLIWTPPVQGESIWNLVYLAGILILYNLAYTLNQIPYTALLPDLALTEHHRVRMSAWTSGFMLLGLILSALAGPLIERVGYAGMGLAFALLGLPLFYLPLLVLRERREPAHEPEGRPHFFRDLATLRHNRAFVIMTVAGIFSWATTTFVQSIVPFIVTEICGLTEGDAVYFYLPAVGASLLCYPAIMWLADRVGKWRVFTGSLLASAVVLPGLLLIDERWPLCLGAQGVVWITLQAIALSGVTMLPPAFGAEIVDHGTALTGQHREGTYYAVWGLLDQVINGAAAALLPLILLLGRSRTDPRGPLGVRLVGPLGGVLMLVGFFVFLRYPLRERRETAPLAA